MTTTCQLYIRVGHVLVVCCEDRSVLADSLFKFYLYHSYTNDAAIRAETRAELQNLATGDFM
jgi:hypothetical protein